MKISWRLLKDIINKKKSSGINSRFVIDGNLTTDKNQVAKSFNSFFVNVGPTLARKIPDTNISPTKNLKNIDIQSMLVNHVTKNEVEEIIKSLKISSAGWDFVSPAVVKKIL